MCNEGILTLGWVSSPVSTVERASALARLVTVSGPTTASSHRHAHRRPICLCWLVCAFGMYCGWNLLKQSHYSKASRYAVFGSRKKSCSAKPHFLSSPVSTVECARGGFHLYLFPIDFPFKYIVNYTTVNDLPNQFALVRLGKKLGFCYTLTVSNYQTLVRRPNVIKTFICL